MKTEDFPPPETLGQKCGCSGYTAKYGRCPRGRWDLSAGTGGLHRVEGGSERTRKDDVWSWTSREVGLLHKRQVPLEYKDVLGDVGDVSLLGKGVCRSYDIAVGSRGDGTEVTARERIVCIA